MDKATPPAPVKLKTSNSLFSLDPSGTAYQVIHRANFNSFARIQQLSKVKIRNFEALYRDNLLPKTNLSFPGPLMIASVARYWSPKACLPMHIGFVQPGKNTTILVFCFLEANLDDKRYDYSEPGTRRGTFLQMIGSLKTVPAEHTKFCYIELIEHTTNNSKCWMLGKSLQTI